MFISIAIPLTDGERVRPYTVASSPEEPASFEIVFNRVPDGVGTAWLFARAVGDEISFTGPYGAFTLAAAPDAALVFIAESTAIAPIRPMMRRALATGSTRRVELLYAADRPEHLLYLRELEALAAAHPRLHISTMVVSGGSGPLYARLGDEIRRRWIDADTDRSRHFYICGVGAGVIELRDQLRGAGYERRSVHYEKW
jgi:ferredoxin-NADP reductase